MAFESFTLELLTSRFGLSIVQNNNLYSSIASHAPSDLLTAVLKRNLPLVIGKGTEKARSEMLIAPILVEVREILEQQIAVFSGVAFNVDKKLGLYGFCDFLISQNPLLIEVQSPVIMLVEAKREDLSGGIAQCIAEMVAAKQFNRQRGQPKETIFGVVTSGTDWRFLQLEDVLITLDLREYSLTELESILGILTHMASQ